MRGNSQKRSPEVEPQSENKHTDIIKKTLFFIVLEKYEKTQSEIKEI